MEHDAFRVPHLSDQMLEAAFHWTGRRPRSRTCGSQRSPGRQRTSRDLISESTREGPCPGPSPRGRTARRAREAEIQVFGATGVGPPDAPRSSGSRYCARFLPRFKPEFDSREHTMAGLKAGPQGAPWARRSPAFGLPGSAFSLGMVVNFVRNGTTNTTAVATRASVSSCWRSLVPWLRGPARVPP